MLTDEHEKDSIAVESPVDMIPNFTLEEIGW